jgi:hypothetical protein
MRTYTYISISQTYTLVSSHRCRARTHFFGSCTKIPATNSGRAQHPSFICHPTQCSIPSPQHSHANGATGIGRSSMVGRYLALVKRQFRRSPSEITIFFFPNRNQRGCPLCVPLAEGLLPNLRHKISLQIFSFLEVN